MFLFPPSLSSRTLGHLVGAVTPGWADPDPDQQQHPDCSVSTGVGARWMDQGPPKVFESVTLKEIRIKLCCYGWVEKTPCGPDSLTINWYHAN